MHKMQSDLQMPYLRAIQAVPGNTASQKLCWIEKLTSYRASGDPEQLPQELLPILRTEIAVNEKKYEDITTALKSEDWTIVNRAFKAAWFFDGSHKNIVNAEYFCEHVFPYVSMNTRGRIVITLANRLTDPELAQQLFTKGYHSGCKLEESSHLLTRFNSRRNADNTDFIRGLSQFCQLLLKINHPLSSLV
ncbi:uncharacterized protein LOC126857060 isoform X2 [Cataglyphis hispanica]|uniref:uncharacterized protein LOC126857060 isoform X2 n=1 Tax=Cataglyphis hispanica TaxID=1086592 RepID=UPI00217FAA30|nr:uncharacterized protein LOC126857060 isoform X2 [Cataglyphis hispanica]